MPRIVRGARPKPHLDPTLSTMKKVKPPKVKPTLAQKAKATEERQAINAKRLYAKAKSYSLGPADLPLAQLLGHRCSVRGIHQDDVLKLVELFKLKG
jgi:hypothetical protein